MTQEEATKIKALFSARLEELLKDHDLTQVELSKMLGVSESTIGKWILQKSLPRMGVVEKLAIIFNRPKSYFFDERDNRQTFFLDPHEQTHIKKYRQLDADSKEDVDDYVDMKLAKVQRKAEEEEQKLG